MSGIAAAVGLGTAAGGYLASREQRKGAEAAADAARFRPVDIDTPLGSVDASMGGYTANLTPDLERRMQGLLGMSDVQMQAAQSPQASLDFLNRIYGTELDRQSASLESRQFNQGLLGTTTGALQTEALSKGQNQALLEGALSFQNQAYDRGLGLLGTALEIGSIPSAQIATSGNISSGASAAGARAGQFITQGANQRANNIASTFAGLGQAAGSFIGRMQQPQPPTANQALLGGTFLPNTGSSFSGVQPLQAPPQSTIGGFRGAGTLRY